MVSVILTKLYPTFRLGSTQLLSETIIKFDSGILTSSTITSDLDPSVNLRVPTLTNL